MVKFNREEIRNKRLQTYNLYKKDVDVILETIKGNNELPEVGSCSEESISQDKESIQLKELDHLLKGDIIAYNRLVKSSKIEPTREQYRQVEEQIRKKEREYLSEGKVCSYETLAKISKICLSKEDFLKIEPLIQKVLLDLLSRIHEGGNQEAYRNIERITGIKPTMEQIQEKLLRILFYGNPETYKSIIKFTHIKPTNTQIQKKQIECISENNTNTQSEIITGIKPPKEEIQAMQTGIILKGDYEGYNRLIEETGIKLNEKQIQELKSKIQESELSCLTFGDKKGYNWIVELIGIKLSKLNIQQEELRLLSKGNIGSQAIYEMLVENTGIEPNKQQLEKLKQEER